MQTFASLPDDLLMTVLDSLCERFNTHGKFAVIHQRWVADFVDLRLTGDRDIAVDA
jgi:hypothetical protein